MGYSFEASPEERQPRASGSRRGGPPNHGTVVDVLNHPDPSLPKLSIPIPFKKISAIIGLALVLLAVGLLRVNIAWPR
jgi:hypothetical protein